LVLSLRIALKTITEFEACKIMLARFPQF